MTYKGRYSIKNPKRYKGDPSNVIYRSLWERNVFKWLDEHSSVIEWNSEEVVVPYRCPTDGKVHRYFVDIYVKFDNNNVYIIEIKPHKQTLAPIKPKRNNQKYVNEVLTYVKNTAKWEAATKYALSKGWTFQIWTENEMDSMGIHRMKRLPKMKRAVAPKKKINRTKKK